MLPAPALWIVDTCALVGLAKVGCLELLVAPTREVWVVDVVEREVLAGPATDPARQAIGRGWGVRVASPPLSPVLAAMRLDAGEAAVLASAGSQPGSVAIMDDSAGRAAAKALGIAVVGTVGVLLQAKQEGRLTQVVPVLRDLQSVRLFLPREGLLTALMTAVGEVWP